MIVLLMVLKAVVAGLGGWLTVKLFKHSITAGVTMLLLPALFCLTAISLGPLPALALITTVQVPLVRPRWKELRVMYAAVTITLCALLGALRMVHGIWSWR